MAVAPSRFGRRGRSLLPQLATEALANLYAVRQRSLLALIGIVIGTASVIAMINVGYNGGAESIRRFEAMGTDVLVARPGYSPTGSDADITLADVAALPATVASVAAVAPLILSGTPLLFHGQTVDANVVAATAALRDVARLPLRAGRFVSDFDRFETFAVVGTEVVSSLSTPTRRLQLGDQVRLENYMFTVIGILGEVTPNPLIPVSFDNAVIIPFKSMRRVMPDPEISSVAMRVTPDTDPLAASAEIERYFQARLDGRPVQVQSARQLIAGMQRQAQVFTYLLGAIGGISLIVGGVGIMNVMLMGVAERRREIGVRLAIGARRGDIRTMFMLEAVALSLAGGILGTLLGVVAAYAFAQASGWQFEFFVGALPLGAGISALVGLFFGIYPAAAAARLDPIAALRTE